MNHVLQRFHKVAKKKQNSIWDRIGIDPRDKSEQNQEPAFFAALSKVNRKKTINDNHKECEAVKKSRNNYQMAETVVSAKQTRNRDIDCFIRRLEMKRNSSVDRVKSSKRSKHVDGHYSTQSPKLECCPNNLSNAGSLDVGVKNISKTQGSEIDKYLRESGTKRHPANKYFFTKKNDESDWSDSKQEGRTQMIGGTFDQKNNINFKTRRVLKKDDLAMQRCADETRGSFRRRIDYNFETNQDGNSFYPMPINNHHQTQPSKFEEALDRMNHRNIETHNESFDHMFKTRSNKTQGYPRRIERLQSNIRQIDRGLGRTGSLEYNRQIDSLTPSLESNIRQIDRCLGRTGSLDLATRRDWIAKRSNEIDSSSNSDGFFDRSQTHESRASRPDRRNDRELLIKDPMTLSRDQYRRKMKLRENPDLMAIRVASNRTDGHSKLRELLKGERGKGKAVEEATRKRTHISRKSDFNFGRDSVRERRKDGTTIASPFAFPFVETERPRPVESFFSLSDDEETTTTTSTSLFSSFVSESSPAIGSSFLAQMATKALRSKGRLDHRLQFPTTDLSRISEERDSQLESGSNRELDSVRELDSIPEMESAPIGGASNDVAWPTPSGQALDFDGISEEFFGDDDERRMLVPERDAGAGGGKSISVAGKATDEEDFGFEKGDLILNEKRESEGFVGEVENEIRFKDFKDFNRGFQGDKPAFGDDKDDKIECDKFKADFYHNETAFDSDKTDFNFFDDNSCDVVFYENGKTIAENVLSEDDFVNNVDESVKISSELDSRKNVKNQSFCFADFHNKRVSAEMDGESYCVGEDTGFFGEESHCVDQVLDPIKKKRDELKLKLEGFGKESDIRSSEISKIGESEALSLNEQDIPFSCKIGFRTRNDDNNNDKRADENEISASHHRSDAILVDRNSTESERTSDKDATETRTNYSIFGEGRILPEEASNEEILVESVGRSECPSICLSVTRQLKKSKGEKREEVKDINNSVNEARANKSEIASRSSEIALLNKSAMESLEIAFIRCDERAKDSVKKISGEVGSGVEEYDSASDKKDLGLNFAGQSNNYEFNSDSEFNSEVNQNNEGFRSAADSRFISADEKDGGLSFAVVQKDFGQSSVCEFNVTVDQQINPFSSAVDRNSDVSSSVMNEAKSKIIRNETINLNEDNKKACSFKPKLIDVNKKNDSEIDYNETDPRSLVHQSPRPKNPIVESSPKNLNELEIVDDKSQSKCDEALLHKTEENLNDIINEKSLDSHDFLEKENLLKFIDTNIIDEENEESSLSSVELIQSTEAVFNKNENQKPNHPTLDKSHLTFFNDIALCLYKTHKTSSTSENETRFKVTSCRISGTSPLRFDPRSQKAPSLSRLNSHPSPLLSTDPETAKETKATSNFPLNEDLSRFGQDLPSWIFQWKI